MLDIGKLTEFRRDLHQHPESSFQEFRTQQQIINYLKNLDVKDDQIIPAAKTGLFVNLIGEADPQGEDRLIAFRADIDALVVQEKNQHLPYRSINNCAHMCGHDGHTTMLLGFASLFQQKRNEIPKNKKVRLLFQPAEEQFGGSVDMIKDGCLNDVNEVYGCHQWPSGKIGQVWVTDGPMMSEPVMMNLHITGKGGHASEPHKFKNPTTCGAEFICTVNDRLSQIKRNFTFAWTCFNAGTATNIIPDTAVLSGQIRSLEVGLGTELFEKTKSIAEAIGDKYGCKVHLERYNENYPLTANTKQEGNHILRLGKEFFGEGNSHSGPCPVYASEDFGNYTLKVPGAFFFLSSGKNDEGNPLLHQSNFDFNDDLIEIGSKFWMHLAKDRLYL